MSDALESFMNLCRFCLKPSESGVSIFNDTEATVDLLSKINTCLPVRISDDDDLPKKICGDCSKSIDFIFNFRQMTSDSEKRLLVMLENIKEIATEIAVVHVQESDTIYHTLDVKSVSNKDPIEDTNRGGIEIKEVYFGDYFSPCELMEDEVDTVIIEADSSSENNVDEILTVPADDVTVKQISVEDAQISQIVESSNVSLRPFEEDNATLQLWDVTLESDFFLIPYDLEQPKSSSMDESALVLMDMDITNLPREEVSPVIYTCHLCENNTFDQLLTYLQHYEFVHKQFKCPFCVKSFKRLCMLEGHLVVHSTRREFACSFCKCKFKRKTDRRQHILRMHTPRTEDYVFNCEHCAYRTKHKRLIRTHVLAHLGISIYECKLCGKHCQDSTNLLAHHNSHIGIKPYQCEVCGNRFTRKNHMLVHRKMQHEELCSYQCDICGRAFSYKTSLVAHLKLHTGENRVQCDICLRMISSKVALANHKKIHYNEKEFVCGICGKMYVNKYSLQEHVLTHTGSKPFQCLHCDKSFSMRKKLLNHERIHDQMRSVFRCSYCGKSYLSKFRLKDHVQKSHTIVV